MNKRTDTEILKDLVEAIVEYNSLRDDEWDFDEENGDRDFWDDGTNDTHEKLLSTIMESRNKVRNLLAEATDNKDFSF
jgi:hypothetical protein